jgi:TIR domain
MNYNGTVFLSYARADDVKPPFDEKAIGWISFFWGQLRYELTMNGAKEATLWVDRYQIEPAEAFTEAIKTAVINAKVMVPVFSVNWAQSDWCRREVDSFGVAHPDASRRIVPVFKNEVDPGTLPEIMKGEHAMEGYRFFTSDPTGKINEFYWRGLQDESAYYTQVKKIALAILKRLGLDPVSRQESIKLSSNHKVFLAFAARELADARQRLKNDLIQAGITVIPTVETPPDSVEEFESVVRAALAQAEFAVFFLGEKRGSTPEGGNEPILVIQLRLARESASTQKMPRILWTPRWLPGQETLVKRDPFEIVGEFGGLQQGEEIYGGEVTDLSQWLRKRLESPPEPVVTPKTKKLLVVASAQSNDDGLVADMANLVQEIVPTVKPLFADENWGDTEIDAVVLIPWGTASVIELNTLLEKLPQNVRTICLRLPGGDEPSKRRFFKAGVFVDRINALPSDRRQAQELLQRLEINQPTKTVQ